MKIRLERFALGLILAPLAPLAGFLISWWAAYTWLPETWIPAGAISGLSIGILADIFFLKRLLKRRPGLPLWVSAFLFYSVGVFGFSMGVPVLNAALAIPAGFVIGSRLAAEKADQQQVRKAAQRTAWFTSAVLVLVCAASALLALLSSSTASDLRGMLGLGFEVTQAMIIGLILFGGAALVTAGWGLTFASVRLTFAFLHQKT